jgi:hypothetical protein
MDPFIEITTKTDKKNKKEMLPKNFDNFKVIFEFEDIIIYKNYDYEQLYLRYDYGVMLYPSRADFVGYSSRYEWSHNLLTSIRINETPSIDVFSDLGITNGYIKRTHNGIEEIDYTNCNFLCNNDDITCINYNNYLR